MKRSTFNRIPYSIVLAALLLSAVAPASVAPAATPVPAQVPPYSAPLPPGGATRFLPPADLPVEPPPAAPAAVAPEAPAPEAPAPEAPEVEEASPASPAAPDSPNTCTNPGATKPTFGQDLELILGPINNNVVTRRLDQPRTWVYKSDVSYLGPHTQATPTCTSGGPKPEEVYFYENDNYGGWCTVLTPGEYPVAVSDFPIRYIGDNLQSIKVGKNVAVQVWRDRYYEGGSLTVAPGEQIWSMGSEIPTDACWPTICNNQASSAKVWLMPHVDGNVSIASLGTDSNLVLMKTLTTTGAYGDLASMPWNAHTGWGPLTREGLIADGNPVVVVRGQDLLYFVRSGNNIKFKTQVAGEWGAWANLPGATPVIADAASDPVVLVPDLSHIKLFYRTTSNTVKLMEWERALGWRTTPLDLGKPSGTTIVSELNAIARDENHAAVFGVGADSKLYVRDWSIEKKPDWSDAPWVAVGTNIKNTKPALASRHTGHLAYVTLDTAGTPYYREWNAARYGDNLGSPRGWKDAVNLGGGGETVSAVGTYSDEMFALHLNSAGNFYSKQWTENQSGGAWAGWGQHASGWATGQVIPAVAGRPHDLMLVGRAADHNLVYERLTNSGLGMSATSTANPGPGTLRGQAIATVSGRTYWFSAYRNSVGKWTLEARNTSAWGTVYTLDVSDVHGSPTTSVDMVSLAAGDLNKDGNAEVVLATINPNLATYQISSYKLVPPASTPLQRITWTGRNKGSTLTDINVAIGDLDGDGAKNEIIVALRRAGQNNVFLRVYRGESLSWAGVGEQWVSIGNGTAGDLEMAIGQVDGGLGQHVILASHEPGTVAQIKTLKYDPVISTQYLVETYNFTADGAWPTSDAAGAYSSALAAGDIDSDGLEEAVYAVGGSVFAISLNITPTIIAGPAFQVGNTDAQRSLAVGEVDGDGRPEIVYNAGNTGWTGLLKLIDPRTNTSLDRYGQASGMPGVPLLADVDGDSQVATYKYCQTVDDVRVVGVVNSFPVYYQDGISVQNTGGGMANSKTSGNTQTDGWSATAGGSIAIGFEHEWDVPIFAIKLGEVSAKVEAEFTGGFGGGTEVVHSITEEDGYGYGSNAFSQGGVCYTKTSYTCYYYDLGPVNSTYTTTAMMCQPVQPAPDAQTQFCDSLEDWYSMNPEVGIRLGAGDSWAPVGHHTTASGPNVVSVNVTEYPTLTAPPVDPYLVWWKKAAKIDVGATTNPGGGAPGWGVEKGDGVSSFKSGSFESKLTVSGGFKAMDATFEASVFGSGGVEWSTSVDWETTINFSGEVNDYPASSGIVAGNDTPPCPTTVCTARYAVVPFVYQAPAKTLGGLTYNYLEQDYYKTTPSTASEAAVQEAQAVVGLTPQAPEITSPTHPDPATWYPAGTVTFNWRQPAGDPAHVIGYRWNINHTPVATPTAMVDVTTTHTYQGLADGVYYVHIQAVGDTGERGPVTHRAVRVDTGAPQVRLLPDPSVPNGSNGWYVSPITFTVASTDTNGSGVKSIETSADGTTWQPYTPIYISADTPGRTLWARATDNLGHVSNPVATTFKLDQTPPSVRDSDRYGLSYANIITDEVGNMQLVLGGAISDALSGRYQVEVKAGDTGAWNAISAVGDLPMPPGNWFTTTMTGLQWIYTPTFEIRGAYPLYVRGVDMAGNIGHYYSNTLIMPGGCFWWDPVAEPALDESRVSVSPHQARAGDVVAFTVAARDSGYQEAQYLITDTVPAGLTVLPDSISDGGQYDASTRQIVWTLHAAWPGQTRYLFFNATVDSATATTALENRLDLMSYWPWDRTCDPRVPPEPARHYYSTSTTLTVLPGAAMHASAAAATSNPTAPQIINSAVAEGEVVGDPNVTLLVNAGPEARSLYVKEWVWNGALSMWSLAHESGWVPFETAAGLAVSEDDIGKYGRYDWTLSQGDGVKYLGIWVADADGQTSNLNEGNLIYTNLVSAGGQHLAAGGRVQYRVPMRAEQLAVLTLLSLGGDADLYVWKPRAGLKPNYYSNAVPTGSGLSLDSAGFYAPEEGMYVIEVQAATDAYYRLVTAGDISGAAAGLAQTRVDPALVKLTDSDMAMLRAQDEALRDARRTLPQSTHLLLADKARPAHPLTLTTPFSVGGIEQLPEAMRTYKYYFPLISRR